MYEFPKSSVKVANTAHQQALTRRPKPGHKTVIVAFSILLSPTYQVPVLWFTPDQFPLHGPWDLDTVYQYLVPHHYHTGLRQVGILGGISMAV
jgi:ubiquitin-like-conjugating enzyme ATG10